MNVRINDEQQTLLLDILDRIDVYDLDVENEDNDTLNDMYERINTLIKLVENAV